MLNQRKISKITSREVLDSRGNPTIEVKVHLKNGLITRASVPSGASTGIHEALELRDKKNKRYLGKGVLKAVKNVNEDLNLLLKGIDVTRQQDIDKLMIKLDDTKNKSELGANAILGVSLACCRAGAASLKMPLYKYIRRVYKIHYKGYKMPRPMINILNGGAHANWILDIQEFMILPKAKTMSKRVQIGSEIFHYLHQILKQRKMNTFVGDEGGYAVDLKKNEDAFKLMLQAIKKAGYKPYKDVDLAIDAAASEFFTNSTKSYKLDKRKIKTAAMIKIYQDWLKKYKLLSIEDPFAEDEWLAWQELTKKVGNKCMIVGDDLFVTNKTRLEKGIELNAANSILIKLNQIGSLTETIEAIYLARKNQYTIIISHRSGETCDSFISDLSVAVNAEFIKAGSFSRSERISKYNRLMEIEEELG